MKVELTNIHKRFGKVHANRGITLCIPSGTIQGILGENGAGKSTLMKVLSGFIQADEGQICLNDQPVVIHSPAEGIQHGIGMLHQDPLDFPPMKVIDNFILGSPKTGLIPDRDAAVLEMRQLQESFDFNIDPDEYVDTMTVGERQQLEILRLLWLGARVLILDEPTTGISALQKEKLFLTLKKLASQGVTIIFVSHKLEEVEFLCDRVAVLAQGALVGEVAPPYVTADLVKMMFGRPVSLGERVNASQPDLTLRLVDLCIEDYRIAIKNVNLNVNRGEVIGLAGMEGSGQRQFLRTLCGLMRPVSGHMYLNEKEMTGKNYHQFMSCGAAFLPAARLEEGLIAGLTLTEHFMLAREEQGFFIDRSEGFQQASGGIQEFSIRGTPVSLIEGLSGGNQQRALLALMRSTLDLLLMEHPTRGLDMESAIWVWSKLKERCRQNTSIIFISSDLEEVLHYSDRILVFFGGQVSEPIPASETSVDQLGQLIGGKGF